VAYYDPEPDTTEEEMYAGLAADELQKLAPVPDPEPDDYAGKAERAEFLIYRYLVGTSGGLLSSKSVAGISKSFNAWQSVKDQVIATMSPYVVGGTSGTSVIRIVGAERG
jgi:hypothetical protein